MIFWWHSRYPPRLQHVYLHTFPYMWFYCGCYVQLALSTCNNILCSSPVSLSTSLFLMMEWRPIVLYFWTAFEKLINSQEVAKKIVQKDFTYTSHNLSSLLLLFVEASLLEPFFLLLPSGQDIPSPAVQPTTGGIASSLLRGDFLCPMLSFTTSPLILLERTLEQLSERWCMF